ncbi:DNA-cytosine methyltransferase [Escherichia coli]|uniref:DNA-cytosine methyltransferase n=1 Tax=Escherichia coli TaxID=562 RepID=A0A377K4W9_ECOLX|nr:DNA-cytosine methyltransferase [Escherichia coli]
MQENISVTDSYSTGNAAQAMLEKLLQIYDVKTLVAQLNGVGENHWNAAILKRALANDSAWHRLSEKEFAHLQTLLPQTTGTSSALCVSLYRSICRNWRHPSRF